MDKINWFPGHMKRAVDEMNENIKKVDVIIYVLDARCPKSCINPAFADFVNRKKVIYYFAKTDLAGAFDPRQFGEVYAKNAGELLSQINRMFPTTGGINRLIKAMVIGMPNVGKSTIINKIAKRKKTMTGDRAGVTKQTQWVEVTPRVYLMDTAGVLTPNLTDERAARNLAYVGCVRDDVLDLVELAGRLIAELKLPATAPTDECAARTLLQDFRNGKYGKFNLEGAGATRCE